MIRAQAAALPEAPGQDRGERPIGDEMAGVRLERLARHMPDALRVDLPLGGCSTV